MKAAFLCEFATIKSVLLQMMVLYLLVGGVVGVGTQSLAALTACIAAMSPFMIVFTLSAYDTANDWERFRACLPFSRNAVVASRYGNVLLVTLVMVVLSIALALAIGAVAPSLPLSEEFKSAIAAESNPQLLIAGAAAGSGLVLFVAALTMPFILRFGMTKATRIIPVLLVLLIPLSAITLPGLQGSPVFGPAIEFAINPTNLPVVIAVFSAVVLVCYAISCFVAMRLYRSKEL